MKEFTNLSGISRSKAGTGYIAPAGIFFMVTISVILSGQSGWIMTPGFIGPFPSNFYFIISVGFSILGLVVYSRMKILRRLSYGVFRSRQ